MQTLCLTAKSVIEYRGPADGAVALGIQDLKTDLRRVFGPQGDGATATAAALIVINNLAGPVDDEHYTIHADLAANVLSITGGNTLGTLFGIYRVARDILGVDPFHHWSGVQPERRERIPLPGHEIKSPVPRFRFRGWFINGEDSLIGASGGGPVKPEYYDWIFETLLRTQNNMIIPGTFPEHNAPQFAGAIKRGLWLTHHHAEPMGAPLFSYVHPGENPDFRVQKERYRKIYLEAARWYAEHQAKAVFTVSFRGQGDCPFWSSIEDKDLTDDEKRAVIAEAIQMQVDVLEEVFGPGNYRAAFPFYGEMQALFINHLNLLPPQIILCWADNGYGAMRVRRIRGVTDENQSALPEPPVQRPQGVYYHVNFHDSQASNQLTMLVSTKLILSEYQRMYARHVRDFSICNAGNIRPHMFGLDFLSAWLSGELEDDSGDVCVENHARAFFRRWMPPQQADRVARLQIAYFKCPILVGDFPDQLSGDEFYHFMVRALVGRRLGITGWENANYFLVDRIGGIDRTVEHLIDWTTDARKRWLALLKEVRSVRQELTDGRRIYDASLHFQTLFNAYSNDLLLLVSLAYQHLSAEQQPYHAFVLVERGQAVVTTLLELLQKMDNGFLPGYYTAEFLTNVRASRRHLNTFLDAIRIQVDGTTLSSASRMVNSGKVSGSNSILYNRRYCDDNTRMANAFAKLFEVSPPVPLPEPLPEDFAV